MSFTTKFRSCSTGVTRFSYIPYCRTARSFSLNAARARGALIDVHPEVEEALSSNRPVVALETAVITHGFPYPGNVSLGMALENTVREQGAIPATIGLIGGRIKIGLKNQELERLASGENRPAKISRRDITTAMALKSDGGTTCSATLIFAALAGIKVFATGGLGGVHRGGESSMDVSADLHELTRCPVALVSAGIKSILDIPRTLEYLETLGVPVLTYGSNREFPAFFSRRSGVDVRIQVFQSSAAHIHLQAPWNVNDPAKAAEILYKQWQLGMDNGTLFAVPIPGEFEEVGESIQQAVDKAVAESVANGVDKLGKEATPWLLSRVGELTQGASRASNIALLQNTALVGGVARNIAEASHRILSTSNENALSSILVSPIGHDAFGRHLSEQTKQLGMRIDGFVQSDDPTAVCNMILDQDGNLLSGIADMDIAARLEADPIITLVDRHNPGVVALDGNLSPATLQGVVEHCNAKDIPVFFEPTSVVKSAAIMTSISSSLDSFPGKPPIAFASPNTLELAHMYSSAESLGLTARQAWWETIDDLSLGSSFRLDVERLSRLPVDVENTAKGSLAFLNSEGLIQMAVKLLPFFQHLIIKCGERGVTVVMWKSGLHLSNSPWGKLNSDMTRRRIIAHNKAKDTCVIVQHFSPHFLDKVVNVTGAGDSLVGALLAKLTQDPHTFWSPDTLQKAFSISQSAAVLTLKSSQAVSPLLSDMN
ncbi:hypothetical protein H0H93_015180 [Arthromyces matolae]|nr:hypothetical protein H0H93_015180 [Arthromyces matolae]